MIGVLLLLYRGADAEALTPDELDALVDPEIFPVSCETCRYGDIVLPFGETARPCLECNDSVHASLIGWEPKAD